MRRLRPLMLILAALAVGVHAPDAAAKKRKPPPPAAKPDAVAAGLRPALNPATKPSLALPPLSLPGGGFVPQSLAANGFAMGGLRSGLPPMGDPSAQCRAACTATRISCDDDPSTPVCAPRWAQCVAGCDR